MTDRPILFSSEMVRALLEGRKVQTRRLAFREISKIVDGSPMPRNAVVRGVGRPAVVPTIWTKVKPGDRLWVRERAHIDGRQVNYAADCDPRQDISGFGYGPSIHMPRWASRITLEVTKVRVHELQKIDGLEALAEGITPVEGTAPWRVFFRLWNSLHGEGAWQKNPEVVALTFKVHNANIDSLKVTEEAKC